MKVLVDAGGTKTDWYLLNELGTESLRGGGYNPFTHDSSTWLTDSRLVLSGWDPNKVEEVHYYGAGILPETMNKVKALLMELFPTASIELANDLLAVARALAGNQSGLVGILGTGAAGGFYDGQTIQTHVPSLGFMLGDEGGGSALGRKWLTLGFRDQLVPVMQEAFRNKYLAFDEVLEDINMSDAPNAYLASYAMEWAPFKDHPEVHVQLTNHFMTYFETFFPSSTDHPVYLSGSVAFHFRSAIDAAAKQFSLILKVIESSPMAGLIRYHQNG